MAKTIKLGDLPGCSDHEHKDWLIGPVGHTRDSVALEESNWQAMRIAYLEVDPSEKDHEIHGFNHWACGWIEECAYRPDSEVAKIAKELRFRLENHPVLDEELLSQLESEQENG